MTIATYDTNSGLSALEILTQESKQVKYSTFITNLTFMKLNLSHVLHTQYLICLLFYLFSADICFITLYLPLFYFWLFFWYLFDFLISASIFWFFWYFPILQLWVFACSFVVSVFLCYFCAQLTFACLVVFVFLWYFLALLIFACSHKPSDVQGWHLEHSILSSYLVCSDPFHVSNPKSPQY